MSREEVVHHKYSLVLVNVRGSVVERHCCMYCGFDRDTIQSSICIYGTSIARELINGSFERNLKYCERTNGDRSGTQTPTEK